MTSQRFKMEYLKQIYDRYLKASKPLKSNILDEFCRVAHIHRKHAIRLLSGPKPDNKPYVPKPRRLAVRYGPQTIAVLADIWEATHFICSQRLKAALPVWIPWARQHLALTPALEKELLAISPRQIDRRLAPRKRHLKTRLYGTTKPGWLLKHMIPVRTDFWDVKKPGFTEADLVSHSGPCAQGDFLHTLNVTDIKTAWGEQRALLGKSEVALVEGLRHIESNLPFPLKGIDSDNGSEFINHHLWAFCRKRPPHKKIQFTRSREYKKDDNAHIEQKNGDQVRKLIGYDRYDTERARLAMNDLYAAIRVFNNLFLPSMTLSTKVRKGARLIRRYHAPRTPFQRVLECPEADPLKVKELQALLESTNPFELTQRIDTKLAALRRLISKENVRGRAVQNKIPIRPFSRKLKKRAAQFKKHNLRWLTQITQKGALAR